MLTTAQLLTVGTPTLIDGEEETVVATPPVCLDKLPDEYAEKLGEYKLPRPFIVQLNHVELSGSILVGHWRQRLILDIAYNGRLDVWERNYPYYTEAVRASCYNRPVYVPCAASLVSTWSRTYFHWITEMLPKLRLIRRWEDMFGVRVKVFVHKNPEPWLLDSLECMGKSLDDVIEAENPNYIVERMLIPYTPRANGFTAPSALNWLRNRLPKETTNEPRKLWLSRNDAKTRRCLNEDEVIPEGFKVVRMGQRSWSSQVAISKQAEVFVGPHGSAFTNIVYAENPSIVELQTPVYVNPCMWLVACAMGWKYGLVMCEPSGVEDMIVDPVKLRETMEKLL